MVVLAAAAGRPDMVSDLLARGADPAARDNRGDDAMGHMKRRLQWLESDLKRMDRSRAWHPESDGLRDEVARYRERMRQVEALLHSRS